MKPFGKGLWTGDFTRITLSSVISGIGGEAMSLPISLLVFEKTQSTLLAALIWVCEMLPDILLPVFVAPLIDRGNKKRWVIAMDGLLAAVYLVTGLWIASHPFQYGLYVAFTLVVGTISVLYRLAYGAWYPSLIPTGHEQRGYAVSGTLYPAIAIVMAPVATLLYTHLAMHYIFYIVTALTVLSVLIKWGIRPDAGEKQQESYGWRQYKQDFMDGLRYMKREKGIRNIFTYMAITNGVSSGINIIVQAWYQTVSWLTVTMLGLLTSAEMVGRLLGGVFCYHKDFPVKKRFAYTKFVYFVYDLLDMMLLFMPYPLMLASRFLCGSLGSVSATIRSAAVQSYLPDNMRARVNAFSNAMFSVGGVLFRLLAGWLGTVLPYRAILLIVGSIGLAAMVVLIVLPGKHNRPVYEAVREKAEGKQ